jgi:hypothetical protein
MRHGRAGRTLCPKKEGWTFEPKRDGPDTSYKSAILEARLAEGLPTILVAKQR